MGERLNNWSPWKFAKLQLADALCIHNLSIAMFAGTRLLAGSATDKNCMMSAKYVGRVVNLVWKIQARFEFSSEMYIYDVIFM